MDPTAIKVGVLVRHTPSASAHFRWQTYQSRKMAPGLVLREIQERGTTTRRFEIRWHDGEITQEWISYLEPYEV